MVTSPVGPTPSAGSAARPKATSVRATGVSNVAPAARRDAATKCDPPACSQARVSVPWRSTTASIQKADLTPTPSRVVVTEPSGSLVTPTTPWSSANQPPLTRPASSTTMATWRFTSSRVTGRSPDRPSPSVNSPSVSARSATWRSSPSAPSRTQLSAVTPAALSARARYVTSPVALSPGTRVPSSPSGDRVLVHTREFSAQAYVNVPSSAASCVQRLTPGFATIDTGGTLHVPDTEGRVADQHVAT